MTETSSRSLTAPSLEAAALEAALPPELTDGGLTGRLLGGLLRRWRVGSLSVTTPGGRTLSVRGAVHPQRHAHLDIHRWRAIRRLVLGGDLGLAEAYIDGDWSSPDLAGMLTLGLANRNALDGALEPPAPLRLWRLIRHRLNANSKTGSRRNIAAHYDLGNDFYRPWLDAGMQYSSALYRHQEDDLETAQAAKLAEIRRRLDVSPGAKVLEIGCGWGAVAEALTRDGAEVVGLTLSREQLAFARQRLERAGLAGRADLRLQDYRDADGQYDAIVSIEMIEAVGEEHWPTYFRVLAERLKPGASALIQAITIRDDEFEAYRSSPDFIQRHVFPGGMLPSPGILKAQAEAAGLGVAEPLLFGPSYARTLADWDRRFQAAWPKLDGLAPRNGRGRPLDTAFKRLWEYYFAYCIAGFSEGTIDVGLWRFTRPAD
ncbi:SAM-dependent methyltransferase [Roseospirillum parvum]|uniref:Cyclopropane-fatty-acyl-phospholipid synthase n=1 Tax=Roseospirillum parvum TaxID=83401 RepID=A0A1G7XYW5_9PROT|nr:cyclopropane-fatty-acyl-phospholipid synthase family protein [Roseospirillum parvum]SDG89357.1 cyclopropane-fatty-acyl-phospholipid synthase [Roseospirillum parvum]